MAYRRDATDRFRFRSSRRDELSKDEGESTQTPPLEREEFPQLALEALHEALPPTKKPEALLGRGRGRHRERVSLTPLAGYPCRVSPRRDVA